MSFPECCYEKFQMKPLNWLASLSAFLQIAFSSYIPCVGCFLSLSCFSRLLFFYFYFFNTGFLCFLKRVLELILYTRLTLNSQKFTYLCLAIAGIKRVPPLPGWLFVLNLRHVLPLLAVFNKPSNSHVSITFCSKHFLVTK